MFYFDGTNWKEIVFPYGAYEIKQFNHEVFRQLSLELHFTDESENPINIEANTATLHSIIQLDDGLNLILLNLTL